MTPIVPWPLILLVLALVGWCIYQAWTRRNRVNSLNLVAAVLVLLIFVNPGGQGYEAQAVKMVRPVDVIFVVDVTNSMVAEDYDGSKTRLSGVKDDMMKIITEASGAYFTIITFGKEGIELLPATTDANAAATAVKGIIPEATLYAQGSDIGIAGPALEKALARAAKNHPDNKRVVIYIGDGEQTAAKEPSKFSDKGIDEAVVLGYGTKDGGKMKESVIFDDGNEREYITYYPENGAGRTEAISKIDEDNLQAIAKQLGGDYKHIENDDVTDLDAVKLAEKQDRRAEKTTSTLPSFAVVGGYYWVFAILLAAVLVGYALMLFVDWKSIKRMVDDE